MNQKSQLHVPAVLALVDCFAIMMTEEDVDFLLQVGEDSYEKEVLQQFSPLRGQAWKRFWGECFTMVFYGCGNGMEKRLQNWLQFFQDG